MKLFNMKKFAADEAGAVTVDWVVLTAAMVTIGVALISTISTGLTDAGDDIVSNLTTQVGGSSGSSDDSSSDDSTPAE